MIDLKDLLSRRTAWRRGLLMLLFGMLYGTAEFVLFWVVLFQFGSQLLTGHCNQRLVPLGEGLAAWIYQCLRFLVYASDHLPFPFGDWPGRDPWLDRGPRPPLEVEPEERS